MGKRKVKGKGASLEEGGTKIIVDAGTLTLPDLLTDGLGIEKSGN